MKRAFLLSVIVILLVSSAGSFSSAKTMVLHGRPSVQSRDSMEDSVHVSLDEIQKTKHRVIISKEGEEYIWETRDRKKLVHTTEGAFDLFTDPKGGGYIKITRSDGKFYYMEHLSLGLNTFTYWGVADHYTP